MGPAIKSPNAIKLESANKRATRERKFVNRADSRSPYQIIYTETFCQRESGGGGAQRDHLPTRSAILKRNFKSGGSQGVSRLPDSLKLDGTDSSRGF